MFEVERQLLRLETLLGCEGGEELGFQASGDGVFKLELGVDEVLGCPGLGDGNS